MRKSLNVFSFRDMAPPKYRSKDMAQPTLEECGFSTTGLSNKGNWVNRFSSPAIINADDKIGLNMYDELSKLLKAAPYRSAHWVIAYSAFKRNYYSK